MVVARQSCSSIDPLRLKRTLDAINNNLNLYDVGIANVTSDSATKNVIFHDSSCAVTLAGFLQKKQNHC